MESGSGEDVFRRMVRSRDYPCVMARSVLQRDQFTFGEYGALDADERRVVDRLSTDLEQFAGAPEPDRGFRSFVAVFRGEPPPSELAFERALWALLVALSERDRSAWDPEVASDAHDPRFSFSFAGRAFFVVGLHPNASRPARRCARPALAFNLHAQFERLRRAGQYERVRRLIRDRDRAVAGDVNTMLDDFGARSEARQYSGREVEDGWRCPFHREP